MILAESPLKGRVKSFCYTLLKEQHPPFPPSPTCFFVNSTSWAPAPPSTCPPWARRTWATLSLPSGSALALGAVEKSHLASPRAEAPSDGSITLWSTRCLQVQRHTKLDGSTKHVTFITFCFRERIRAVQEQWHQTTFHLRNPDKTGMASFKCSIFKCIWYFLCVWKVPYTLYM